MADRNAIINKLKHWTERAKEKVETGYTIDDNLTKYGFYTVGFNEGRLNALEYLLDYIDSNWEDTLVEIGRNNVSDADDTSGTDAYAYYYISNTCDEYGGRITRPNFYTTLAEAKEALKEYSDWYKEKGTGTIFGVKFGIPVVTNIVFEN